MFELIACSLLTIFPDYLYRRYRQGMRIGHEITMFSVWYVLRWGITACAVLTLSLITTIFFFHPSTTNVASMFRTISVLPETSGRVTEIYVVSGQDLKSGDAIFKIDDTAQMATFTAAQGAVAEIDAALLLAQTQLDVAVGQVASADASLDQTANELERKQEIFERNPGVVTEKELESLSHLLAQKKGAYASALASREGAQTQLENVLPAQRKSALAHVQEAQVALDKTTVYSGVTGKIIQFALQEGEIVNPFMRPAGIIIPEDKDNGSFVAGFGQISASVLEVGMIAEITCASQPFKVFPMFVSRIQHVIASGQFRPGDQLVDSKQNAAPGTVLAVLTPLYAGQTDGIISGSQCIANAYSNHHDLVASGEVGAVQSVMYHITDTLGLVHAILLRSQALLLPIRTLVLSGGH
jgi:multidrug resistance efflux pump